MKQLPNLPLELLQAQTILNLSNPARREEFRQSLLHTIDPDDLASVREEIPELAHWSDEEVRGYQEKCDALSFPNAQR